MLASWDGWSGATVPDVLSESMAAVAAVGDDPTRHTGQLVQERQGVRQFVGLSGCQGEGNGPSGAVGDHAGLGAEAAAGAAERLVGGRMPCLGAFLPAPAAF